MKDILESTSTLILIGGVCFIAGLLFGFMVGKGAAADGCQTFGAFENHGRVFICTPKKKEE